MAGFISKVSGLGAEGSLSIWFFFCLLNCLFFVLSIDRASFLYTSSTALSESAQYFFLFWLKDLVMVASLYSLTFFTVSTIDLW
jgi:hypothetical protein